jgi:hypothetical protein
MWWCTACWLLRWGSYSCLLRYAAKPPVTGCTSAEAFVKAVVLPTGCMWCQDADLRRACWLFAGLLPNSFTSACLFTDSSALFPDLQAQDRAALQELTANLNDRHRNAQFAGRASAELHTLIFFQPRAIAADARVVKVDMVDVTKYISMVAGSAYSAACHPEVCVQIALAVACI